MDRKYFLGEKANGLKGGNAYKITDSCKWCKYEILEDGGACCTYTWI